MSKYPIHNIKKFPVGAMRSTFTEKGIFIVVLNAKKRPPHLVLMIDGKAFSLTVKGPKVYGSSLEILKLVGSKQTETLFFKLQEPNTKIATQRLWEIAEKHTLIYPRAGIDSVTCLFPLKQFCGTVYQLDVVNVHFIFDLLSLLYKGLYISACYQMNMDDSMDNETYMMEKYTMKDVNNAIQRYKMIPTA